MPEYFDIHSHLNFPQYDEDRDAVIAEIKEKKVATITVGTDIELSRGAVALADAHDNIYACIGVHPADDASKTFGPEFEELVKHPKVVAVGECGLDYFRLEGDSVAEKKRQKALFEEQIHFAVKHEKLLMIHCRSAYEDATDMLEHFKKEYGDKLWGNAHFFAGGEEIGKRLVDIDFSLSFTGVITFTHDYDEVIKMAPLDMIMSETDAPYVAPVPYRGKRNSPVYVSEVVKRLAEIKGEDLDVVKKTMVENAIKRFRLA